MASPVTPSAISAPARIPSPRKGLPVTGLVAPGIVVAVVPDGDMTAKSGSLSKLTTPTPGVKVLSGAVTKAVPFHAIITLDEVIDDEWKVRASGLRKVPE